MLARIEVPNPFGNDVRVGEVLLVESDEAAFGGEEGLEVLIGGGERDAGVADFEDEIGNLEAVADGAGGGGHVAGEPVDGSAAEVERHLSHLL